MESGYVPLCKYSNGSRYCINESRICDGVTDCEDGADENNPMCPEGKLDIITLFYLFLVALSSYSLRI